MEIRQALKSSVSIAPFFFYGWEGGVTTQGVGGDRGENSRGKSRDEEGVPEEVDGRSSRHQEEEKTTGNTETWTHTHKHTHTRRMDTHTVPRQSIIHPITNTRIAKSNVPNIHIVTWTLTEGQQKTWGERRQYTLVNCPITGQSCCHSPRAF